MKNMKKTLLLCLSFVLAIAIAVAATAAYFTSQDSDVNVMTVGNVKIELVEQQRDGNGGLEDFEQGKELMPIVGSAQGEKDNYGLPTAENYVDKIVTVKNTGKSDAYVRVLVAVPKAIDDNGALHWNLGDRFDSTAQGLYNENKRTDLPTLSYDLEAPITIDGVAYNLYTFTYEDALAAGEITPAAAFVGFYLDKAVDYDGKNYTMNGEVITGYDMSNGVIIPVYAQAVQVDGFANAKEAFEAAGMPINPWTDSVKPDEDGELNIEDGKTVILSDYTDGPVTVSGKGTLVLKNVTITGTDAQPNALTVTGSNVEIIVVDDVTLVGATGGNGICVPEGATLELSGAGRLTAIGNNGTEDTTKKVGGSGIGGNGAIYIHDLTDLTAEGYGRAGFGIGGETASVTIENTHITYVKGGYVQPTFSEADDLWGKHTPEGGAAIGSMVEGAVITLDNVTIEKAEGGSKAAGIGARYWNGVTINITDSTIKSVIGGNASAAIGGSRVGSNPTVKDNININIQNSDITAQGGQYAAGIGSGYDTYCHSLAEAPVTTITIDAASKITAVGGKLGAGIGTGHNAIGLQLNIADGFNATNVTAGDSTDSCCLGAPCSVANNIGLGVIKDGIQ